MSRSTLPDALPSAQLSPALRADTWSVCGRFGKPHGVQGEVRLWLYNHQTELLDLGGPLFLGAHPVNEQANVEPPRYQLTLESARIDAKGGLVSFRGLRGREQADMLKHLAWLVPRSAFPRLSDDEYYLADLIGARGVLLPLDASAQDLSLGRDIGELTEIFEAGTGEIFVFKSQMFGEVLIPHQESFVIDIDITARLVKIREIPGLLEGGL